MKRGHSRINFMGEDFVTQKSGRNLKDIQLMTGISDDEEEEEYKKNNYRAGYFTTKNQLEFNKCDELNIYSNLHIFFSTSG